MTAVYTLRLTLDDVRPTVWRRVRVRGDLLLPQLHELIQDSMGWEDRHLFLFYTGSNIRAAGERYEMAQYLDEWGDTSALRADDVRIDQVLGRLGDSIGYEYDFGDGWGHRLVVEAVEPGGAELLSECVGGERACPPEDCGGPHGFDEVLQIAADPNSLDHDHVVEWLGPYDREHFAMTDANERIALRRRRADAAIRVATLFPAVEPVLVRAELDRHERLAGMLAALEPRESPVDPLVAAASMEKLTWMLATIGDGGLALTSSGYLPPRVVGAMRDELTWPTGWLGKSTREIDNPEPGRLRRAVTSLGLAKVRKGRLTVTREGRRLAEDPVGLWHHVARRLPIGREDHERDAGVLLLVAIAAEATVQRRTLMMWDSLKLAGWDVRAEQRNSLQYLARPTLDVLELVGAVAPYFGGKDAAAQSWGPAFALQCLTR